MKRYICGNMALWMCIGLSIGLSIGSALDAINRKEEKDSADKGTEK